MIRLWGAEKYGLFALSSSLFVSLALLDGGVRSLTRVRLAPLLAEGKTEDAMRTLIHGLLAFMIVCGFALLIALGLCANDFLSHILHLPPGGQTVLLISGILTSIWMTSVLALELLGRRRPIVRCESRQHTRHPPGPTRLFCLPVPWVRVH